MMHYQFETIHPYLDGNGRIGRLLLVLFLCQRGILPTPLLYLSAYFERNRGEYYDRLLDVSSSGNWAGWLDFFLKGVAEQAHDAVGRSRQIRQQHEDYRARLVNRRASGNSFHLLDELFASPFMTISEAARLLEVTPTGAKIVLDRLTEDGILQHVTNRWPQYYVAGDLLRALDAPISEE